MHLSATWQFWPSKVMDQHLLEGMNWATVGELAQVEDKGQRCGDGFQKCEDTMQIVRQYLHWLHREVRSETQKKAVIY